MRRWIALAVVIALAWGYVAFANPFGESAASRNSTNWPGANQVGQEPAATEQACYYSHNAQDKPHIVLASCSNAPVFSVIVTPASERYITFVAYVYASANLAAYFWCGQNYPPLSNNDDYNDCLFMLGGFGQSYSYPIIEWLSAAGDTTSFNWDGLSNHYYGWSNLYGWGQ